MESPSIVSATPATYLTSPGGSELKLESKAEMIWGKKSLYKVLVLGDSGAGKSSFIRTYTDSEKGSTGETEFIEIAAHDISKVTRSLCRKVTGIVVICNVQKEGSVENARRWKIAVDKASSFYSTKPSILVGSKVDLMKDVHTGFEVGADIQRVAKLAGFERWFVISNKKEQNVKEVMVSLEGYMLKSSQTCDYVISAVAKSQRQQSIKTSEIIKEDDIDELKNGSAFIKFCRNGKTKLRILWMTEDGRQLCWGRYKGKASKSLDLTDINGVLEGQRTSTFRKFAVGQHKNEESKARSFSLLLDSDRSKGDKKRTCVDLIATSDRVYETWIRFFQCSVEQ